MAQPSDTGRRFPLGSLYEGMFLSLYKVLAALNGPGERHEYIAALLLSFFMLLNLVTASKLLQMSFGIALLPSYDRWLFLVLLFGFSLLHWLVLIRGRSASYFDAVHVPAWGTVVVIAYFVGSTALSLSVL